MQNLHQLEGKAYGVIDISNAAGDKITLFFDVSSFYSKLPNFRCQPMDSANLTKAQNALSSFESNLGRNEAVRHLSEGLDCLYEIIMDAGAETVKAQAIADRYVAVALKYVKNVLASGSATEPELENAHHLMQELTEYGFGNADNIKNVASETVTQLINKSYTGYSELEIKNIIMNELERRERRT